jgi:hypothetical protein
MGPNRTVVTATTLWSTIFHVHMKYLLKFFHGFTLLTNKYSNKYTYEGQVVIRERRGLGAGYSKLLFLRPHRAIKSYRGPIGNEELAVHESVSHQSSQTNCDSLI